MKYWGKHLLANAYRCNPRLISCPKNIELFTTTLVKKIDMVAYGPCRLAHFGTGNKLGWTAFQMIETSSVVSHYCEENGDAYIDVFSCKDFDEAIVRAVVIDYFKPELLDSKVIYRQAGVKME